jgi:hypothetical protein
MRDKGWVAVSKRPLPHAVGRSVAAGEATIEMACPATQVKIVPQIRPMKKISIKAVLIGGVVDVFSTMVLALPLTFYVMSRLDIAHMPPDRLSAAVTAAMQGNPLVYGIQLALGMAGSILGGYVAGLIARHDHTLNAGAPDKPGFGLLGWNAALSSWLCIALGIYTVAAGKSSHSVGVDILMFALSPILAFGGGYIVQRRTARTTHPTALARGSAGG